MKTIFSFFFFVLIFNFEVVNAKPPSFKKVFIVVLENTNFEDAVKQPFHSELAKKGALLKNFHGLSRPSQPNYLAMISGSTHQVNSNDNVDLVSQHIGDLIEKRGMSWKTYAEDYPGNCFKGATAGKHDLYTRKHVPFLSFKNVTENQARCARIVNAAELSKDVATGKIANFSLYVPNNMNNAHDTDAKTADSWLKKTFGAFLEDRTFMRDMLFVVTYDEGAKDSQHIYTALLGGGVKAGATSDKKYSHLSLLRTIEDHLGLGTLQRDDLAALPIDDIW